MLIGVRVSVPLYQLHADISVDIVHARRHLHPQMSMTALDGSPRRAERVSGRFQLHLRSERSARERGRSAQLV